MQVKKKVVILLVAVLGICLLSAFGFQIDVAGGINKDGGTADVSVIEPLRVGLDLANAALAAAQQEVMDANTALAAAQSAADIANAALAAAIAGGDPLVIAAAQSAADVANAALVAAQIALDDANTALAAAQQAATDANAAYLAKITGNEEDLSALLALQQAAADANAALAAAQQALDDANAVLDALPAGATPDEIAAAQLAVANANAALGAAQQASDDANAALVATISEEGKVSHIITNSNHGGSLTLGEEGNHSALDGDMLSFAFAAEEGFNLVWLRIGNIKITATDDITLVPYFESFNKNNLTIHAHFKKDKDYVPEATLEVTNSEDEGLPGDENGNGNSNKNGEIKDKGNDNGNNDKNSEENKKGNSKENSKEKSNNGKKNK